MLTYTAFLHLYPHPRRSMQTSASVDAERPKPTTTLLYVRLKIKEVIL